jgi:hypothetical protein
MPRRVVLYAREHCSDRLQLGIVSRGGNGLYLAVPPPTRGSAARGTGYGCSLADGLWKQKQERAEQSSQPGASTRGEACLDLDLDLPGPSAPPLR